MRYQDKTFTLPASPTITQEAWDAIWKPSAASLAEQYCGDMIKTLQHNVRSQKNQPPSEQEDELPPQDLPLDPSTPVRPGLPRGCF